MKEFIVGIGLFIVFTFSIIYQHDYNRHQEEIHRLKAVSEEVAAAASQYFNRSQYGEGFYVFNELEGIKAAEIVIRTNLYLNDDLSPKNYSYWKNTDKVKYQMDLISSTKIVSVTNGVISKTVPDTTPFPKTYSFIHYGVQRSPILFGPSVVVTINTGKASYTLIDILQRGNNFRTSIHTLEE